MNKLFMGHSFLSLNFFHREIQPYLARKRGVVALLNRAAKGEPHGMKAIKGFLEGLGVLGFRHPRAKRTVRFQLREPPTRQLPRQNMAQAHR